jgi:hypothetical protein
VVARWFPGEGGTPDGEAFLAELRGLAVAWGLADVRAQDTGTAADRWGWLVAWTRVPGLRDGRAVQLQVGLGQTALTPPLVAAWETEGLLLDVWDELDLWGFDPSPSGMARRAFGWLDEQLRRPVEWRAWPARRPWTRSPYRAWCLADTGELVCPQPRGREPPRRPPERVERLR